MKASWNTQSLKWLCTIGDITLYTVQNSNFKTRIYEFGSTKRFYSIINQNYLELGINCRSRFRDTDIEASSVRVRFSLMLCYVVYNMGLSVIPYHSTSHA